jgi:protein involved in polysaccharide export with SLBB domain
LAKAYGIKRTGKYGSFRMRRGIISAVFAVLAWLMAGSGFTFAQDRDPPPPPARASSGAGFEYHLGAGDKLRIIVFGEESLTGEFFVSGGGKIAFPLIGDVDAVGLTIPELQAAIAAKLADGYLKQPRVSAEVLNYRPFYILGEVMKPGEYP